LIDLVICTPTSWGNPGGFDDNVYGQCARGCDRAIQWRPHAPAAAAKVCVYCALPELRSGVGYELVVSEQVLEDLRRYARSR
jgi:hypothetical protein